METMLLILLGYILIPIVALVVLYWVIRTGVRDGIVAAEERKAALPR